MTTRRVPSAAWLTSAIVHLEPGERVYATGIPWAEYERLLGVRDEHRRGVRITYDRGSVELETRSLTYEPRTYRLKQLVLMLAKAANVPLLNAGPISLFPSGSVKGLEPDDCFYLADAEAVLGRDGTDRAGVPPPDLVIRAFWPADPPIDDGPYADRGVPELWRHEDGAVAIFRLGPDGQYRVTEVSHVFPQVTASAVTRILRDAQLMGDLECMRQMDAWVTANARPDTPAVR
jgi:hypothetical protein